MAQEPEKPGFTLALAGPNEEIPQGFMKVLPRVMRLINLFTGAASTPTDAMRIMQLASRIDLPSNDQEAWMCIAPHVRIYNFQWTGEFNEPPKGTSGSSKSH